MLSSDDLPVVPRCCVWCGGKVPKDSDRSLCAGHARLAHELDDAVWKRMSGESEVVDIPVFREKAG